jgi:hypothetical protein
MFSDSSCRLTSENASSLSDAVAAEAEAKASPQAVVPACRWKPWSWTHG